MWLRWFAPDRTHTRRGGRRALPWPRGATTQATRSRHINADADAVTTVGEGPVPSRGPKDHNPNRTSAESPGRPSFDGRTRDHHTPDLFATRRGRPAVDARAQEPPLPMSGARGPSLTIGDGNQPLHPLWNTGQWPRHPPPTRKPIHLAAAAYAVPGSAWPVINGTADRVPAFTNQGRHPRQVRSFGTQWARVARNESEHGRGPAHQLSRITRSSWRRRSGSNRMSILAIFPCAIVNRKTARG